MSGDLDSLRLGDPRTLRLHGDGGRGDGADCDDHAEDDSTASSSDLEAGGNSEDQVRNSLLGDRAEREARAARLAHASNALQTADKSLDRTSRALADTERLGALTTAQLLSQRESFLKQRAQLAATDEYLKRSKGILGKMQHRLVTDKIFQGMIILAEMAVIAAIVYFKYYR